MFLGEGNDCSAESMKYPVGSAGFNSYELKSQAQYQPPTMRRNLEDKRDNLQSQLLQTEAALKAMDDNPNLEQFMELIRRAQ